MNTILTIIDHIKDRNTLEAKLKENSYPIKFISKYIYIRNNIIVSTQSRQKENLLYMTKFHIFMIYLIVGKARSIKNDNIKIPFYNNKKLKNILRDPSKPGH